MVCSESWLQLFSLASDFARLHGNDHTTEIRFGFVVYCILKGVLKDTEGGIFSIELIIDPEPTNFIPKRIFADKEEVHFYSFWCTVIDAMLHLCTFECFTLSM
jgi:hypothetical protein